MAKEKSCLITTSLISSVNWCMQAPDKIIKTERGGDGKTTWKDKAENDLISQLSRERGEISQEAVRGIEFEKRVYKYANEPEKIPANYSKEFKYICNEVNGFLFYQKGGRNVKIDGHNCYLYVKYDAIKSPIIKDIKTTDNYKYHKYLDSFQHKLYCYIAELEDFEYIIGEWDKYPKLKGVYKEQYKVKDWDALVKDVEFAVKDVLMTLKDMDLWDLYREKFCLY